MFGGGVGIDGWVDNRVKGGRSLTPPHHHLEGIPGLLLFLLPNGGCVGVGAGKPFPPNTRSGHPPPFTRAAAWPQIRDAAARHQ